jgi:acetate kinase
VRILVINPGSSSLKLSVIGPGDELENSIILQIGPETTVDPIQAIGHVLNGTEDPDAIGVRFVHGGPHLRVPVVVNDAVLREIEAHAYLAPLHDPTALQALRTLRALRPRLPVVACFDTAFHRDLPPAARTYALPPEWTLGGLVQRYGFHGLSHAWTTRRVTELTRQPKPPRRLVTAHLGAGASLAAVADGRSVETTMGFTPMEGLVMATRSGSIDPGALIAIARQLHLDLDELEAGLDRRSGLAGLSGIPGGDMRAVLAAAGRGDTAALFAIEVYCHRLVAQIAAMTAALGGLDALAFTGGVGEGSAEIRWRATEPLRFLGVEMDPARNEAIGEVDGEVGAPGAAVCIFVVHAREDLQIAHETRSVLGPAVRM